MIGLFGEDLTTEQVSQHSQSEKEVLMWEVGRLYPQTAGPSGCT
jgi:hypothetical protein